MGYAIFQNSLQDCHFNSWSEGVVRYSKVKTYNAVSVFGSEKWKPEMINDYEMVAIINADDLDGVFEVGNIGPEEKIVRLKKMYSISVGDVIVNINSDFPDGYRAFMVDPMGFGEIRLAEKNGAEINGGDDVPF